MKKDAVYKAFDGNILGTEGNAQTLKKIAFGVIIILLVVVSYSIVKNAIK